MSGIRKRIEATKGNMGFLFRMKRNSITNGEVTVKMMTEYDFSNARRNPYADKIKRQISINLNQSTIDYFKNLAIETGIPYQKLINLYLTDCAEKKRKPDLNWVPA